MGIDINSKLLYGMRYDNLVDQLTNEQVEQLDEALEWGEIESASPYYDASKDRWFVGYALPEDFDLTGVRFFLGSLEEAEEKFKSRFGRTGTVRSCNDVT